MNSWKAAGLAAAAIFVLPAFAAADQSRSAEPGATAQNAPVKDCTRFNGYFGYYGNQWCTPEEQARWDKWEAERLRATTGAGSLTRL